MKIEIFLNRTSRVKLKWNRKEIGQIECVQLYLKYHLHFFFENKYEQFTVNNENHMFVRMNIGNFEHLISLA